ncbi:Uncharacterised protein [Streptococcus pneumoniae]|nr:Uncharacterised protein [Streptococcus pneumoniae]
MYSTSCGATNSTKKLEKNEGKRYDRKEEILEEEHVTY